MTTAAEITFHGCLRSSAGAAITGMSLVAMAAPSAMPPRHRIPPATRSDAASASRAPSASTCEFVTTSLATSGHHAQSAAHHTGLPRFRSARTSRSVTAVIIRSPAAWNAQYSAVTGTTARTPAKNSSAMGG
ncbi:hypothetical protein CMMCAS03_00625 [Clavibacter michiganensis subsp. michiganensis]|nr:hypothetical protein CMMCAS03_00625 [Clavibacter michiganensis subsp. michiganensis]